VSAVLAVNPSDSDPDMNEALRRVRENHANKEVA